MPKTLDLTNQVFNYLKALEKLPSKNGKTYWLCECQLCGNKKAIQTCHLVNGSIKSCGCLKEKEPFSLGEKRKCILCQKDFIPNNPNRKYCYECSPKGMEINQASRLKKRALKKYLIDLKGGKCEKCGYSKCQGALQFHHIDPSQKEFNFSHVNLNDSDYDLDRMIEELEKCKLLCANCHFEEHYMDDE